MMKTNWNLLPLLLLTACDLSDLENIRTPVGNETSEGGSAEKIGFPQTPGSTPTLAASLGISVTVDLRGYDGPVMDQFGGTCSAFATAAAMNNLFRQKGILKQVSERDLWDLYRRYDMDEAIRTASSNYLTESKYWPANSTNPVNPNYRNLASLKITQYRTLGYGRIQEALQALHQHHPVVMAIQTPRGLSDCKTSISSTSESTSGQHVVAVVGYHLDDSIPGGGQFIVKNSWGSDCGDRGYHAYPFALCQRSDLYCYFSEIIQVEDRN